MSTDKTTMRSSGERHSHEYQRPHGVYLSLDDLNGVHGAFANLWLGDDDVDGLMVTDAEEILGIGDWGSNGMAISQGKLAVYAAAADIDPGRVVLVMPDVGTDNEAGAKHQVYPNDHVNIGRRPGEGCRRQDAGPVAFPASRKAHRRLPDDAGDMTLRCLIVDDSRRFLDAARSLLERQGITVVGEASTSAEALRLAVELQPDVTLLDIDLGGESGCELARRLSRETNTALSRMILISTHAEQDYADLIVASPAVGFLSKSTLSAGAIRDLLGSQRDREPGDLGPVPQIFGGDHDAGIHQDSTGQALVSGPRERK
jgi:CheY-like chemotaxis protein